MAHRDRGVPVDVAKAFELVFRGLRTAAFITLGGQHLIQAYKDVECGSESGESCEIAYSYEVEVSDVDGAVRVDVWRGYSHQEVLLFVEFGANRKEALHKLVGAMRADPDVREIVGPTPGRQRAVARLQRAEAREKAWKQQLEEENRRRQEEREEMARQVEQARLYQVEQARLAAERGEEWCPPPPPPHRGRRMSPLLMGLLLVGGLDISERR